MKCTSYSIFYNLHYKDTDQYFLHFMSKNRARNLHISLFSFIIYIIKNTNICFQRVCDPRGSLLWFVPQVWQHSHLPVDAAPAVSVAGLWNSRRRPRAKRPGEVIRKTDNSPHHVGKN